MNIFVYNNVVDKILKFQWQTEMIMLLGRKLWAMWEKSFLKKFQRFYAFFSIYLNLQVVMRNGNINGKGARVFIFSLDPEVLRILIY